MRRAVKPLHRRSSTLDLPRDAVPVSSMFAEIADGEHAAGPCQVVDARVREHDGGGGGSVVLRAGAGCAARDVRAGAQGSGLRRP